MNLPPYGIFPIISGKKITLRQILPSDNKDIITISFYDSIQATTLQQAIIMQEKINKDYNNSNSIHWGIAENTTNKIIGTCGYYRGFNNGAGELGCVLMPQYHGQGFMTSALQLAIEFGIHSIGLKKVWAVTTTQNERAKKLLNRLNFIKTADLNNDELQYELMVNDR